MSTGSENQPKAIYIKSSGMSRRKRVVLIIFAGVFILGMVAVGGWWWLVGSTPKSVDNNNNVSTQEYSAQPADAYSALARSGDVSAYSKYDEAIAKASGEEARSLLIDKAVAAVVNAEYDMALDAAKKADEIKSDVATLSVIGAIYEEMGDFQSAKTYYQSCVSSSSATDEEKALYSKKVEDITL